MEETIRRIWAALRELRERIIDVEINHGETTSVSVVVSFPNTPHNNQLVVRSDLTPPAGGQMYRYNSTTNSWLRIT